MRPRHFKTFTIGLLLLAGCNQNPTASNEAEAKPAANAGAGAISGGWVENVTATADGGFRIGNPNAKVKLVEYASLTCSHCADFAAKGVPALKAQYIASGKVSLEIRNFVRDPIDVVGALLSRCGGAKPYAKLTEQMFANQAAMFEKAQGMTQADQQRLSTMTPAQQFQFLGQATGLTAFVAQRGIPAAKANACLTDQKSLDQLVAMRNRAVNEYQLTGTPMFLINGKRVDDVAEWTALEPKIKAAL
ncbi:thioredoxin domain-containing protein [Aquisediminimonas sediminicola]|uniref:thioredoxin domain-containing protein n=1 Tax=Alteraquisediminimonas sediminicola TaxID=2676787 RepID=UPI001C8DD279|nr:thioredoxin domain-containing protein [Aquisediminimonas sediminicola]